MQKKNALDYFSGGMVMPNRKIVNGEPYRYGYQGEFAETDPETGKPAFQLRLYDPRINRWLSPDPMGQYHSPYMAMDNTPQQSVDPTGGCTDCSKCPSACDELGIFKIPNGSSVDFDFALDGVYLRNDLASTMGDEAFVGGVSMNLEVFSDFLHRGLEAGRVQREMDRVAAHNFFMGSGALYEDNTLAELAFGGALYKKFAYSSSSRPLYHYTSKEGFESIMESKLLNPSTGYKNARYGDGQYFTDIAPGAFTRGQVSYRLYGVPGKKTSLTHYIKIETGGIKIVNNKAHNFLHLSSKPLKLKGKILDGGESIFK